MFLLLVSCRAVLEDDAAVAVTIIPHESVPSA
jgi:hypothetical protein